MVEWDHSLRCVGVGFAHARWQDVEWLLPSLPINRLYCVDLSTVVLLECHRMLIVEEIAGADRQAEKPELTEPHALDSVGRCSRNQAPVIACWRWSSLVAALMLDQLLGQS